MKKIIVSTLIVVLLCAGLFVLTGCENNKENKEVVSENTSKQESIVGVWKNDTTLEGYEFIYTFKEDGTGEYDAAGTLMPFTYTINGDQISILYEGDTETLDTTFSIDGDTLNVLDSMGNDTLYKKISKSEQTGTAGSNIPLKDNMEEVEYQIKVAMQYLFEEVYGDKVFDARIYVDKIYSAEDEEEIDALKQMNLGPNEVAFEVKFELKPAPGANISELTIPDGEYDEESEWITGLHRVGILRPDESSEQKYKITDYGTGR